MRQTDTKTDKQTDEWALGKMRHVANSSTTPIFIKRNNMKEKYQVDHGDVSSQWSRRSNQEHILPQLILSHQYNRSHA